MCLVHQDPLRSMMSVKIWLLNIFHKRINVWRRKVHGWENEQMGEKEERWVGEWMVEKYRKVRWIDGRMTGWVNRWTGEWKDG